MSLLNDLNNLRREAEREVSAAANKVGSVASGLLSGGLTTERAVELLSEVEASLRKVAN